METKIILSSSLIIKITLALLIQFGLQIPNYAQISDNSNKTLIAKVECNLRPASNSGIDTTWTLKERMTHYNVPAVSIAVIKDYEIDWAKAYGWADKAGKVPATIETLFQAASISKSINALGVLRWVETNNINLDSDFSDHLKAWKLKSRKNSNGKKITLENLLSHTGGISGHGFNGYQVGDKLPTTLQILNGNSPANSKRIKSVSEPNMEFNYSGGGITITQLLLSENTKTEYANHMAENIMIPIGMILSTYVQRQIDSKVYASAYWSSGNKLEGGYHIYPEMAAAGLWSTPTEISKFIIEIQKSYIGESNKLISQDLTRKMLEPYLTNGITGLGVFLETINDKKYFTHGGSNEGFKSYYYGSLEGGNGIVIMINSENFDIIPEIVRSVVKVYEW